MKTLIVYFSRTGTTKKVAEYLIKELMADVEEITAVKNYNGPIGYLKAGREGMKKIPAEIKPTAKNPVDYDLVIIGTPIWVSMASPIRAYLNHNKNQFKKIAFFCTMGGSNPEKTFKDMAETCGQAPVATLNLLTKEVQQNKIGEKINQFLQELNR